MTPTGEKVPLAELPVPSTYFRANPVFEHPGGEALLRFEFDRSGAIVRSGLQFEKVRAYRFRTEGHVTIWHVQGVYDTLVEVTNSDWVAELLAAEPAETWGHWTIRHFMIYIESAGCYEIAAAGWSWEPEELLT